MQANTDYLTADVQNLQAAWGEVRAWARKVLTSDATEDFLLATANIALVGTIVLSLHKAMQVYASAGFGPAGLGLF